MNFNPRTHMGCDTVSAGPVQYDSMFQSTHPHGVRQPEHEEIQRGLRVSIHAPTWGATVVNSNSDMSLRLQSTHPLGCDFSSSSHSRMIGCFNPRSHMGCDKADERWVVLDHVSIHAPTGVRRCPQEVTLVSKQFQSTHPHGVRRCRAKCR